MQRRGVLQAVRLLAARLGFPVDRGKQRREAVRAARREQLGEAERAERGELGVVQGERAEQALGGVGVGVDVGRARQERVARIEEFVEREVEDGRGEEFLGEG